MADSILLDNTGTSQAYVNWAVGGLQPVPVYTEFEVYIPASALTLWVAGSGQYGPDLVHFSGTGTNGLSLYDTLNAGAYDAWTDYYFNNSAGALATSGGAWHTVQWGTVANGSAIHLVVDGVDVNLGAMPASIGPFNAVRWGILYGPADGTMYLGALKVGTTLGGSDLLNYTPATDGDPTVFDALFSWLNASMVTAPTPPPSAAGGGGGGSVEGVNIAFTSDAFDTPTWVRLDG